MLRTTPQQQREDRRLIEGDVVSRATRRQIARSWRGDSPELLAGASLVLSGPNGLTLILGWLVRRRDGSRSEPPPRGIRERWPAGQPRHSRFLRSMLPFWHSRLAQRPGAGSSITAELVAELAAIWPVL